MRISIQNARSPLGSARFRKCENPGGLTLVLGLRKSNRGSASFPFAALFQEFDALEALEDGTFAAYGGAGLEAVVLGHLGMRLKIAGGGT
jgi:hypothetical protein